MELDALWLLQELKKATSGIDAKAEPRSTLIDSLFGIFKMRQGPTEANDTFLERYKSNIGVVELSFGDYIFCCTKVMVKVATVPTDDEITIEKDRFKAMLLLKNADEKRYGGLIARLKEGASLGRVEYPTTVADMYELMCSHCAYQPTSANRNNQHNNNINRNGVNLLQHGSNPSSSVHLLQLGVMLTQSKDDSEIISSDWILLDTCSTDSVFNNKSFLTKVSKCKNEDVLNIVSNGGGAVSYDTTGFFNLLSMPVYYNKKSLANVLSFKQVAALDGVRITIDTSVEKAMLVHVNNMTLKFRECKDGLYFLNMKELNVDSNKTKPTVNYYPHVSNNVCLVNTVNTLEQNKSFFTKKQIKMAELAKKLQQNMGFPGNDAFKKILQNNLILNSPVTVDDFNRSLKIFGTSESILKGRMTAPSQVSHSMTTSPVPDELKRTHKNVKIYTDLFYVNSLCF